MLGMNLGNDAPPPRQDGGPPNKFEHDAAHALVVLKGGALTKRNDGHLQRLKHQNHLERNARYRTRKHYFDQIKQINNGRPFTNKVITVWDGDVSRGGWIQVTQLSHIGSVYVRGSRSKKGKSLIGVVAMRANGECLAIEHSLIRLVHGHPCVAKQGSHKTAKGTFAKQLTGKCFNGIYIRVLWDTLEEEWLFSHQVEQFSCKKRIAKTTKRYVPGAASDLVQEKRKKIPVKIKFLKKQYSLASEQFSVVPEQLHQPSLCKISTATQIAFSDGNDKGFKKCIVKQTQSLVELSLTYDVLRGNLCGGTHNMYMDAIAIAVNMNEVENKKAAMAAQWNRRKKNCAAKDCSNYAHCSHGNYCTKHSQKPKKLCVVCNIFLPRHKGGLCKKCFNEQNKNKEKCTVCQVRTPRQFGGKCSVCTVI